MTTVPGGLPGTGVPAFPQNVKSMSTEPWRHLRLVILVRCALPEIYCENFLIILRQVFLEIDFDGTLLGRNLLSLPLRPPSLRATPDGRVARRDAEAAERKQHEGLATESYMKANLP